MKGVSHQIMKRYTQLWRLLAAIVATLIVGQLPLAAGTMEVDVYAPTLPATESDIITLWAMTTDDVMTPSFQTITTNLEVNGSVIQWDMISNLTSQGGVAVQVPMSKLQDIGPLPAGTYNVTATWTLYNFHYDGQPSQFELDMLLLTYSPVLSPRTGTFQFTVVPEPATLSVLTAGLCLCGVRRR